MFILAGREARLYWNENYSMYCVKFEVAVATHAPHYALFVGHKAMGSTPSYQTFQNGHKRYIEYLTKTKEENKTAS